MRRGEIRFGPPGGCFSGVDETLADTEGVTRESILELEWGREGMLTIIYRIKATEVLSVESALEGDETVEDFEITETDEGDYCVYVSAHPTELMEEVMVLVDSSSIIFETPIFCTQEGFDLTLLGPDDKLQQSYEKVPDDVNLTIKKVHDYVPDTESHEGFLTERQAEALEVAHELGFYESPRGASYEEIADRLDCSPSSANDLLRRTEGAIVSELLD